jgi:hypothetical protein
LQAAVLHLSDSTAVSAVLALLRAYAHTLVLY